jgi:DNA-directed RNA polymerase subunit omega
MMIYPPIDEMAEKIGNKYKLVVGVAKRARQLQEGAKPLYQEPNGKLISTALREIEHDMIMIEDHAMQPGKKSS